MTIIDELDFDAMTDGSAVSLTLPWKTAAGGQIPIASADAAIHGAQGCRYVSTTPYGRIDYVFDSPFTAARVLSFYFDIRTFSSVNHYIASVPDVSGALQGDWRINTARTVSIRNGSTAVATSTTSLSTGVDYRADWKVDPVANTQELRIYEGESATALTTLSGTWSSDTGTMMSVGPNVAATGGAIDYDTVRIADDWLTPEVPPVELTPVLRRFRYNGSFWE